ncbi:CaiB/BaiF CoA-transferase family protein [Roseiflexus sp.]|uniref:CaiB/BaiF CoA transferase family protein n=1 Tax=Roseiflexus sp. TaxID=2562120 RepID=UPI0021DDC0F2|nr:CaiB/BaiF CoA-transferase family protein [Roseiflexus sp.]GIW02670.1 MAG: CoA transferase [Roseiflexus sp.]
MNQGVQFLRGVRVIELSHAVLGPACGLVLAELGATVTRVERAPDGDDTRRLKGFGMGYFPFFNRGKRSVAIDLKTAAGLDIVKRMVAQADVIIENFSPGVMERLGLAYRDVATINPRLIYCSLKGFLPGPYEKRLALDEVVQMMSGLAYMTGPPGQPLRAGASVIDIMSGLFGALGVITALHERAQDGRGRLVQSGLFETAAFVMGHHMAYAALTKTPVPPMPARVSAWSVYRTFTSADGQQIFIGITSDKHWRQFCMAFGREDLLDDPRLATNNQRINERERLLPLLEQFFVSLSSDEILRRCEQAGIPFAPVARPEDLFTDPHLLQSNTLVEVELPGSVHTRLPRLPMLLDGDHCHSDQSLPPVGAHTGEVLAELGYTDAEMAALSRAGVIVMTNGGS